MVIKIRRIAILGAVLTCWRLSAGLDANAFAMFKSVSESVEYSVLERKAKYELIEQVQSLSKDLKTASEMIVNLRKEMSEAVDNLQDEIERSSSVSGFFGNMWRYLFGGSSSLSRQISQMRRMLNR